MKIPFSCPACGAAGSVDPSFAGRPGRCTQCKARFTIPRPGEAEDEAYALDGPLEPPVAPAEIGSEPASAFIRARGDERTSVAASPKRRRGKTASKAKGRVARNWEIAWGAWLLRGGGLVVVVLVAIALAVPRGGAIVGASLLSIGSLLVLLGFAAGAYGAFCEDFLYGFLYLVVPFYAAYYLVTRWEDLWPWFACSTSGVGLVLLGTEILRWSGAIP